MNVPSILAKQEINRNFTAQGINNDSTTGTDAAGAKGSGWDWAAFWDAITHVADTAANRYGQTNTGQYQTPYPQQPTNPLVTYGVGALLLIIALALVYKILK